MTITVRVNNEKDCSGSVRCIILLNATETQDISFFLIYISYFSDLSRYTEGNDELVRESLFQ